MVRGGMLNPLRVAAARRRLAQRGPSLCAGRSSVAGQQIPYPMAGTRLDLPPPTVQISAGLGEVLGRAHLHLHLRLRKPSPGMAYPG